MPGMIAGTQMSSAIESRSAQAGWLRGRAIAAHERELDGRLAWLVVGGATILAAALRLPFLEHQSLWLDEVFTRGIMRESTVSGLWNHIARTESTPPLYYLIGWLARASSAAGMRLISAVALIAVVPVGYLAVRRLVGARAALASAAVLAVSPMLVFYSLDARSYGLFVLSALFSVWAFGALLERASPGRYALWVLAAVACAWTHYFAVFLIGGEAIVLFFSLPGERARVAASTVAVTLCALPLAWLISEQTGDERAAFIEASPLSSRIATTVRQLAMGPNVPRTWLEASGLVVWCLAVGLGAVVALRGEHGARALLLVVSIAIGTPLLMALTGVEDRFYVRNLIAVLPLLAALAAPMLLRLSAVPLAIYLALALLTSLWVATDWRYEQVDWRDAIARVERIEPRAPVLAVTPSAEPVVAMYLHRSPLTRGELVTRRAWLVVEPTRDAGERSLEPAPVPLLAGFSTVRELQIDAFRLILVGAGRPAAIAPSSVGDSSLFPGST